MKYIKYMVAATAALTTADAQVLDPDIPGPEGGTGFFGIRVVRDNGLPFSIFDAQNSLLNGGGNIFDDTAPWINHSDPDAFGVGLFGSDLAFPGDTGGLDDNLFSWLAKGFIFIPTTGIYTLGFDGDDGHALTVEGADFTINGGIGSVSVDAPDTMVVPDPTSRAFTTGSTFLTRGIHRIQLTGFELGGGTYTELFSATGNASGLVRWLLIGDETFLPEVTSVATLVEPAEVINSRLFFAYNIDAAKDSLDIGISDGTAVFGEADTIILTDGSGAWWGRPGELVEDRAVLFPIDNPVSQDTFATRISGKFVVDDGDEISGETLMLTFGLFTDDGSEIRIIGEDFIDAGLNGDLVPVDGDIALRADFFTGNTNAFATIELSEGEIYHLEGHHWDAGGEAAYEIWVAPGDFRDDFNLGGFLPLATDSQPIIKANQGLALVNEAIQVEIEAHPQNNKNAVDAYNINSRKHLDVAILSTAEFDATLFSEASLTLSDPNLSGVVSPISTSKQDVNRDGLLDLVVDFGTARSIAAAGAIDGHTSVIQLIGILGDDFITGHDDIKVLSE